MKEEYREDVYLEVERVGRNKFILHSNYLNVSDQPIIAKKGDIIRFSIDTKVRVMTTFQSGSVRQWDIYASIN